MAKEKHKDYVSEALKDRVIRNSIKVLVKTKISKIPAVRDAYYYCELLPWTKMVNGVIMDICTVCNAKCVYCVHQRNKWAKPQFMDFDTFSRIVGILSKEDFKLIYLFLSGEPFLHPRIYDMMELVIKANLDISMATRLNTQIDFDRLNNLLAATEFYSERRIGLLITIDSFEHPEVISPGMNKDLITQNIKELAKFLKYEHAVKFQFSSLVTKANEGELDSIKARLASYGFNNWYPTCASYYMSKIATLEDIKVMEDFLPVDPQWRKRFDIIDGKVVGYKKTCGCMIPNISPDGNVSVCFYDMLHKISAGNVIEVGSLRTILNSDRYRAVTKLGRDMKLTICDGCN